MCGNIQLVRAVFNTTRYVCVCVRVSECVCICVCVFVLVIDIHYVFDRCSHTEYVSIECIAIDSINFVVT